MKSKIDWKHIFSIKSIFLQVIGVLCAVIAFKGFMIPNQFIDGGVSGISILISQIFHINIAIPIVIFNLIFLFFGYQKIGQTFAIQSLMTLVLLAVSLQFIEIPTVTEDKVLVAIFGGFFIGMAIGLVIRSGGVIDGLEVITLYTTQKSKFSSIEIEMIVAVILMICLGIFFGWDNTMYSIITYFTGAKTSDYIVNGFEAFTSLTIVSKQSEKIKELLVKDFGKAISVYKGERGYLPENFKKIDCDIVVTVLTRLEIHNIEMAIYNIDPNAFMYIETINEVKGGIVKKVVNH